MHDAHLLTTVHHMYNFVHYVNVTLIVYRCIVNIGRRILGCLKSLQKREREQEDARARRSKSKREQEQLEARARERARWRKSKREKEQEGERARGRKSKREKDQEGEDRQKLRKKKKGCFAKKYTYWHYAWLVLVSTLI